MPKPKHPLTMAEILEWQRKTLLRLVFKDFRLDKPEREGTDAQA